MKRPFLILPAALAIVACDDTQPPTGAVPLRAAKTIAAGSAGNLTFSNTPLLRPDGNSEPEIAIAGNGTMGMVALSWLQFGTSLWTGPFGSTALPTFQGIIDAA